MKMNETVCSLYPCTQPAVGVCQNCEEPICNFHIYGYVNGKPVCECCEGLYEWRTACANCGDDDCDCNCDGEEGEDEEEEEDD